MPVLDELFEHAANPEDYARGFRDRFVDMVRSIDISGAAQLIEFLEDVHARGGTVFVLGNGGSGAVAAHWVNDLGVNTLVEDAPGYRVVSLGDNASAITAVGNDIDFDDVFAAQLRSYLGPDDGVIALSVSGNSPNVLRAVEYARDLGATTLGFTGMDGGRLRTLVDISIHVESDVDEYGPVEDMFSIFMHMSTGYIAMRRGRHLYH